MPHHPAVVRVVVDGGQRGGRGATSAARRLDRDEQSSPGATRSPTGAARSSRYQGYLDTRRAISWSGERTRRLGRDRGRGARRVRRRGALPAARVLGVHAAAVRRRSSRTRRRRGRARLHGRRERRRARSTSTSTSRRTSSSPASRGSRARPRRAGRGSLRRRAARAVAHAARRQPGLAGRARRRRRAPARSPTIRSRIALSLALSRTQDDKGNVRWTLFGASHDGAGAPRSGAASPTATAIGSRASSAGRRGGLRPLERRARPRRPGRAAGVRARARCSPDARRCPAASRTLVTFRPFAPLPARRAQRVPRGRAAARARTRRASSSSSTRATGGSPQRCRAPTQIPLLHLFPRVEDGCTHPHPAVGLARRARGAGGARPARPPPRPPRRAHAPLAARRRATPRLTDDGDVRPTPVSVALFSTDAGRARPLRQADGAQRAGLDRATTSCSSTARAPTPLRARARRRHRRRGRPLRLPLLLPADARGAARAVLAPAAGRAGRPARSAGTGYGRRARSPATSLAEPSTAGRPARRSGSRRACSRGPAHGEAARLHPRDRGPAPPHDRAQRAQAARVRRAARRAPCPRRSRARSSTRPRRRRSPPGCDGLADAVRGGAIGGAGRSRARRGASTVGARPPADATALTFADTRDARVRGAALAHDRRARRGRVPAEGERRRRARQRREDRRRRPRAPPASPSSHARRDLDALGDHLHDRYRALIEAHGMTGARARRRPRVPLGDRLRVPLVGRLGQEPDRRGAASATSCCVIPGHDRGEAVIMADHYDTAYMEDVLRDGARRRRAARRRRRRRRQPLGDDRAAARRRRSSCRCARAGKLARDVWLVHLTGEEFPADCLGARALAQALVERRLALRRRGRHAARPVERRAWSGRSCST